MRYIFLLCLLLMGCDSQPTFNINRNVAVYDNLTIDRPAGILNAGSIVSPTDGRNLPTCRTKNSGVEFCEIVSDETGLTGWVERTAINFN